MPDFVGVVKASLLDTLSEFRNQLRTLPAPNREASCQPDSGRRLSSLPHAQVLLSIVHQLALAEKILRGTSDVESMELRGLQHQLQSIFELNPVLVHIQVVQHDPSLSFRTAVDCVERILLNGIKNATEAVQRHFESPQDQRITVLMEMDESGVRLVVKNPGPKIPDEVASKFGQAFNQASDTRHTGTGLGVASSFKLAQALGGTMGYTYEAGQNCFTCSLPLTCPTTEVVAPVSAASIHDVRTALNSVGFLLESVGATPELSQSYHRLIATISLYLDAVRFLDQKTVQHSPALSPSSNVRRITLSQAFHPAVQVNRDNPQITSFFEEKLSHLAWVLNDLAHPEKVDITAVCTATGVRLEVPETVFKKHSEMKALVGLYVDCLGGTVIEKLGLYLIQLPDLCPRQVKTLHPVIASDFLPNDELMKTVLDGKSIYYAEDEPINMMKFLKQLETLIKKLKISVTLNGEPFTTYSPAVNARVFTTVVALASKIREQAPDILISDNSLKDRAVRELFETMTVDPDLMVIPRALITSESYTDVEQWADANVVYAYKTVPVAAILTVLAEKLNAHLSTG